MNQVNPTFTSDDGIVATSFTTKEGNLENGEGQIKTI